MIALLKRSPLLLALPLWLIAAVAFAGESARHVPTVDDLLQLKVLSGARISPDGKWVAYGVSHSDFKQDAFVTPTGRQSAFPGAA